MIHSSAIHSGCGVAFSLVDAAEGLMALAPEWQTLWDRTPDAAYAMGPAHARRCWDEVARPAGGRLACVVGRQDGRLVLVWPLVRERPAKRAGDGPGAWHERLRHRLVPLSPAGTDYAGPLVEPGPARPERLRALLGFLRRQSGAMGVDVLHLPYVRGGVAQDDVAQDDVAQDDVADGAETQGVIVQGVDVRYVEAHGSVPACTAEAPLEAALRALPSPTHRTSDAAPLVRWRRIAGVVEEWDGYYATLGRATRKVQDKKRRQLAAAGRVGFELVVEPERRRALLAFLLEHKRHWAARTGKAGPWLFAPAYERFLVGLSDDAQVEPGREAGLVLFVLTLDDRPLAVQAAAVGHRVDWIIAAHHAEEGHRSPGVLLNEHCLRWAHARGLDVDMGPGQEANKLFWARHEATATGTWSVALSPWGAAWVLGMGARARLGRLRRHLRGRRTEALRARGGAAGTGQSAPAAGPTPG